MNFLHTRDTFRKQRPACGFIPSHAGRFGFYYSMAIPHKEHLSHNLCVVLPVKAAFAEWIDEQGEDYESQADDIIREWEEYEPDED